MKPELFFIPLVVMMAPVLIVLIVMQYRLRRTRARYQLLTQLADKGVELPAQLIAESPDDHYERRRALVLIGGGLGLMAMLLALPIRLNDGQGVGSLWGIGLLPLFTGLGYLASWWLNQRERARD